MFREFTTHFQTSWMTYEIRHQLINNVSADKTSFFLILKKILVTKMYIIKMFNLATCLIVTNQISQNNFKQTLFII